MASAWRQIIGRSSNNRNPAMPAGSAQSARMPNPPFAIDLALQGGGSHGAFTWGVLDRLLEDGSLAFAGISGTSAGALNGAVLVSGLAHGGPEGARAALQAFWRDLAQSNFCFGLPARHPASPWDAWTAPITDAWQQWARSFSPYQLNPLGLNPLKDVLMRHVDLAALQGAKAPRLFVTATAVRSGQPQVFSGERLNIDALLASACLPYLFQAVEIDGEPYWDGGYSGNPALWPLIYGTKEADLLLVKIQPLVRLATPRSAIEIAERAAEISFNTALVGEMRAIAFVKQLLREQRVDRGRYKDLRLHLIADEDELAQLPPQSKLDTRWVFLQRLFALGRTAAEQWLGKHRRDVGRRSSFDIEKHFLAPR
jgi:NTE family protein